MRLRKLVSGISALAVTASAFAGLAISANAQVVQTDLKSNESFDSYTAGANTEVVTDPVDGTNKVLKISNGAAVTFSDVFTADECYMTMDINFATGITGIASKNYDGLYFAFAESQSKLGSAMKVYGESSSSTVPVGFAHGGGSGQFAKAGDAEIGTWYTVLVTVDKTAATVGYTYYKKADFEQDGTSATPVFSKLGMGYRNDQIPNSLIISMSTADDEYFYIDNVRSYTEEDTEAVNELKAVSFKTTPGSVIIPPSNDSDGNKVTNTYDVELQLTGTKEDLNAEDCDSITWSWIGTEKDDDYIGWNFSDNASSGKISVTSGVSTYFAILTATVTKGDVTKTAVYKFMINSAGASDVNQIYPAAGYPIDLNDYPDSLVGYTVDNGTINDADIILAKWASVGSNGARKLSLEQDAETGDKYIEISNVGGPGAAGNTTTAGLTVGLPTSQIIFEFDARMANGAAFVFANTTQNNSYTAGYVVSFNGSEIKAGDGSITGVTAGTWYKFIVSYDVTIQEYYVKVYDETGTTLIGEITDQKGAEGAAPSILSIGGGFPTDIKNMRIYKPVTANMTINTAATTIKVPEANESDQTLDISATMETSDGLEATGNVKWEFEGGEVSNVSIEPVGAQTARITVSQGAPSGDIVVVASKDGVQARKTIKLTSSSNNVAFTKSVSNITIPFDGEAAVTAEYEAETRTGDGESIGDGDTIIYRLLDSTGTKDANVKGVTFDNGKLTVEAGASPAVVYVYAENTEGISNKVRVNIHGMTFGFGSGEMEEGYTPVTSSTVYNESTGYGFASSSGLTDEDGDVKGTAEYTMQVKVPNGNYRVNVSTTSASMASEVVAGTTATGTTKTTSEFDVAVCDGILDLTFAADSTISSLQISQIAAKTPSAKPAVYSIGDSTTKNSGHYSGYDPATATDHREYASWGNCVTIDMYEDTFSSYNNHGIAGRNSASYYREARLETVLLSIAPGDYVTINMGINSDPGNEGYETLMENYYVQGVLQRGGIPVILTHTPDGVGFSNSQSSYDASTGKFTVSRADQSRVIFLKNLAEKYNLNLIDVGQWGEDYFNSLTLDDLDKANTVNSIVPGYTAPTTVYELVRSWYPDHNHYTAELGSVLAQYIMSELADIASNVSAQYTVTFEADGVTVKTAKVAEGKTVTGIPEVPEKAGFTGTWMLNGEEFTANTVITADTTVTAVYTELPIPARCKVTFESEHASVKVDGETVEEVLVQGNTELSFTVEPEAGYAVIMVAAYEDGMEYIPEEPPIIRPDEEGVYTINVNNNINIVVSTLEDGIEAIVVNDFGLTVDATASTADCTASAEVTNNQSTAITAAIMVAVYDADGKLISVKMGTETIEPNGTVTVSASNTDAGATVKAFLWNTSNNTPLANMITQQAE